MHHVHILIDGVVRRGIQRAAARHIQKFPARAVHVVRKIQNAFVISRRFQQDRARAIAKQNRRPAILVIDEWGSSYRCRSPGLFCARPAANCAPTVSA